MNRDESLRRAAEIRAKRDAEEQREKGSRDPDLCELRWCDEAADHAGLHRKRLFDDFAANAASGVGKNSILQLWLVGNTTRDRWLTIVLDGCEAAITWKQARELVSVIEHADARFYNVDDGDGS